MRIPSVLIAVFLLTSASGCFYKVPLSAKHDLPIDRAVLGTWESLTDDPAIKKERMMVLEFSPTEFLVHYPVGKDDMYFRAYPIKVGDVSCVQYKIIGTEDGPIEIDDTTTPYCVVSHAVADGLLEIKQLNRKLISEDLDSTEALRAAFIKHQANPALFGEPLRFKRVAN